MSGRRPGREQEPGLRVISTRIPGRRTKFRVGYSSGVLEGHVEDTKDLGRRTLVDVIESGIYDNASEDDDDFSSFELGDEEMDDDFSMDNLQLSQISNSSPHNNFQGSRNSMILPLLLLEGETLSSSMYSESKATEEKEPEEDPELEYEYEPGISLGQFEFAQEEALLGGNPFIDYEADLQLAAELGKTLLERNKELENVMKRQQSMVEDQTHEIEYLTKQNLALREVNESRLKVYEQLEVSINDLEDSNRKLVEESKSDKVRIKSLTLTNDRLESRLEELQRSLEESSHDHSILPPEKDLGGGRRRSSDSSGSSSYSTKSSKSSASEKFWEVGDELILAQEPSVLEEEEADPKDGTELDVSSFEEEASSPSKGSSSEALSRLGSNSPASSGYSSDQPYPTYPTRNVSRPRPKSEILESCSDLMNPWRINSPKTSEVKISELEKAFAHLDSENALLKEEIQRSKQTRDSDTVQDEVLKIHDVKVGKLCRRCLGSIESPLAQGLKSIKSVVQQVHSDFIQELFREQMANLPSSYISSSTDELSSKRSRRPLPSLRRDWRLLIRSQNKWLDIWLMSTLLFTLILGLGISMIS